MLMKICWENSRLFEGQFDIIYPCKHNIISFELAMELDKLKNVQNYVQKEFTLATGKITDMLLIKHSGVADPQLLHRIPASVTHGSALCCQLSSDRATQVLCSAHEGTPV